MARRIPFLVFLLIASAVLACGRESWVVIETGNFGPGTLTVSGRLDDPHGLRTPDMVLAMNRQTESGLSGIHVRVADDGSFTTPLLPSGFYSFEAIRTPHSHTHPATAVGVGWVDVGVTNVSGVVIPIKRDMELRGRYRIAPDHGNLKWPENLYVSAPMIVDGQETWSPTQTTHGAEGGAFILRNAYGPRVLRVGYTPTDGSPPAPARVLLDGRDITDVPTDFSEHEGSDLEIVITARPPRVSGLVTRGPGSPARGVHVVMFSADPRKRFGWASTSRVARTNEQGVFVISALPGSYLIQTVPPEFEMRAVLRAVPALGQGAMEVEVGEAGTQRVVLTLPR